jgi:hypothetical protein
LKQFLAKIVSIFGKGNDFCQLGAMPKIEKTGVFFNFWQPSVFNLFSLKNVKKRLKTQIFILIESQIQEK